MTMPMLAACFFAIALIYAAVGFGGGSSYTALLTLTALEPQSIPPVSLLCNLLVVAGSAIHFHRRGHLDRGLAAPLLLGSVPCAFLGGWWPIRQDLFLGLLGGTLVLAGGALLVRGWGGRGAIRPPSRPAGLAVGSGLGLLSGLVGIGGGVFLAPLMLWRNWAEPKSVAATCAVFILVNSVSGLLGQLAKLGSAAPLADHVWLFVAVLAGGQIGSLAGAGPIPQNLVRRLTAGLVMVAGLRIAWMLVR